MCSWVTPTREMPAARAAGSPSARQARRYGYGRARAMQRRGRNQKGCRCVCRREARLVHLLEFHGGRAGCASRCGVDSTHSLRQAVCWAKPNHGFFYCQHLRTRFLAALHTALTRAAPPLQTRPGTRRCGASHAYANQCIKQVVFCSTARGCGIDNACTGCGRGRQGVSRKRLQRDAIFSRAPAPYRVAQADLRRTFRPFRHARHPARIAGMPSQLAGAPATWPARRAGGTNEDARRKAGVGPSGERLAQSSSPSIASA